MSRVLRAKRQNILDIPSEILFCLILEESNIFFLFKKKRFLFCFVLTVFNELMSDALPLTKESSLPYHTERPVELWRLLEMPGLSSVFLFILFVPQRLLSFTL